MEMCSAALSVHHCHSPGRDTGTPDAFLLHFQGQCITTWCCHRRIKGLSMKWSDSPNPNNPQPAQLLPERRPLWGGTASSGVP